MSTAAPDQQIAVLRATCEAMLEQKPRGCCMRQTIYRGNVSDDGIDHGLRQALKHKHPACTMIALGIKSLPLEQRVEALPESTQYVLGVIAHDAVQAEVRETLMTPEQAADAVGVWMGNPEAIRSAAEAIRARAAEPGGIVALPSGPTGLLTDWSLNDQMPRDGSDDG